MRKASRFYFFSLTTRKATGHDEDGKLSLFSAQGESRLPVPTAPKRNATGHVEGQTLSLSLSFQCARRAPLLFENASTRNSTGHDEEDLESRAVGSTVWLHVGSLRLHGAVVSSDKTKGCLPGKRQTLS